MMHLDRSSVVASSLRAGLALLVALGMVASAAGQQELESTNDPALLQRLGILYIQEGQPLEAIKTLERAADLMPENGETHMWLGFAYFLNRQFDEAEESYLRALAHKPDLSEVHNYLGMLRYENGDMRQAIDEFRMALQDAAYPPVSRARVHMNIGKIYLEDPQVRDVEMALHHYRQAVELLPSAGDPSYVIAHTMLGRALRELARPDEAIAAIKKALDAAPTNAGVHLQLGLAYRDNGAVEDACRHLQQVLLNAPGSELSEQSRAARAQLSC